MYIAQLSSLVWSLNKLDVKSSALIINFGRTMDFTEFLKELIKKTEGYENIFCLFKKNHWMKPLDK